MQSVDRPPSGLERSHPHLADKAEKLKYELGMVHFRMHIKIAIINL